MPKRGVHKNRRVVHRDKSHLLIMEGDKEVGKVTVHSWLHQNTPDSFTYYLHGSKEGVWIYPRADLMKKLRESGALKTGKLNSTLRNQLTFRSIPIMGYASIEYGWKFVGAPIPKSREVSVAEIQERVRATYPARTILQYIDGKPVDFVRINDSKKTNQRIVLGAKKHGGLLEVMKKMEHPYGELPPILLSLEGGRPYTPRMKQMIRRKFYSGDAVSPTILLHSSDKSDRVLGWDILRLSRKERLGIDSRGEEVAAEFLEIKPKDIAYAENSPQYSSKLSEEFIRFALVWSELLKSAGIKFPYLAETGNLMFGPKSLEIDYLRDTENHRADARKGNQAIEVKVGQTKFQPPRIKKVIDVYTPGVHNWATGEPIESTILVMDMNPKLYDYNGSVRELAESGITVIGFAEVHDCVSRITSVLKKNKEVYLKGLKPRADNLDILIEAHRDLALRPSVLLARQNSVRRDYIYQLVGELRRIGEQVYNAPGGEE